MSDGTINFAERTTDPDTPTVGRIKLYNKSGDPYYKKSDNTVVALKGSDGVDGAQGIQGIQGVQGSIGVQGPVGPVGPSGDVSLASVFEFAGTITLPNTTTKTFVDGFTFNVPSSGDYVYTTQISYKGHNNANDTEYEWRLDNSVLDSYMAEESKDSTTAARNARGMQGNLGTLSSGNHDFDLYFSKETTGGTARLFYISVFVWRVS